MKRTTVEIPEEVRARCKAEGISFTHLCRSAFNTRDMLQELRAKLAKAEEDNRYLNGKIERLASKLAEMAR